MAIRRMFSKKITNSSEFLMMSPSAQALYLHIGMNSDDDGICELFPIMRMTESKPDDLKALHMKGFVYIVDSKILFVKDWFENNYIRPDRYDQSKYLKEHQYSDVKKMYDSIILKKSHPLLDGLDGIPDDNQRSTEVRVGKDRLEKETLGENGLYSDPRFEEFWVSYPRKVGKGATWKVWTKLLVTDELHARIMEALRKYKETEQWLKDSGRFVPHPTTFLNQRRFDDEIQESKKSNLEAITL